MLRLFFLIAFYSLYSLNVNAAALLFRNSPDRLSNTARSNTPSGSPQYDEIVAQLSEYKDQESVNCNTTLVNSAHALICNCANEAGTESDLGKFEVSRTVFGRAKSLSSSYPRSIKGVICQKSQFSWTIGGWNENCVRGRRRRLTNFNTSIVPKEMLNSCIKAIHAAAHKDFIESPDEIFALNFCSKHPGAYRRGRAGMPAWCRRLVASRGCTGGHCFGFANSNAPRVAPPNSTPSVIVRVFDMLGNFLGVPTAQAILDDTKIVNTRSTKKIYVDDKIKKIIKEKYPTFKVFKFKDFNESAQNLMGETRDNLPMAATGDYNGDNKKDLLLFGRLKGKDTVIAFISEKNTFKSHIALREEPHKRPLNSYIVNIDQKKINPDKGPSRDAFQLENFGGAVIERLLNDNEFVDNIKGKGFRYNSSVKAQFSVPKN